MKKFNFYAITAEDLENNIKGVSEDLYEFYSVVYGKKILLELSSPRGRYLQSCR